MLARDHRCKCSIDSMEYLQLKALFIHFDSTNCTIRIVFWNNVTGAIVFEFIIRRLYVNVMFRRSGYT